MPRQQTGYWLNISITMESHTTRVLWSIYRVEVPTLFDMSQTSTGHQSPVLGPVWIADFSITGVRDTAVSFTSQPLEIGHSICVVTMERNYGLMM